MTTSRSGEFKTKRAEKLAAGICGRCLHRPVVAGHTRCQHCRDRQAQLDGTRHRKYQDPGSCSQCGFKREDERFKMCRRCREMARALAQKKIAAGLCRRCGEKRDDEFRICSMCRKVESMKRKVGYSEVSK